ncbi:MAG: hypothetical protein IPK00_10975 [Deltaproteobacteria bacterium]|nr:hypothetical protein [Deltaproteobacteria bacterium]
MRSSRMKMLFAAPILLALALAGAASAASIQMSPNPATIDAFLGNDFSLRLDSGDSTTNILNFTVTGGGGCGLLCPSTAVAAIVFDGATVLSANDTNSNIFSAGNVVRGLITPDGAVAGLLIDLSAPSSEAFSLKLSSTPTTATLFSLNLDSLDRIRTASDIVANVVDSTQLTFSVRGVSGSAVPEPSAALVFGMGLLVAHAGLRPRR